MPSMGIATVPAEEAAGMDSAAANPPAGLARRTSAMAAGSAASARAAPLQALQDRALAHRPATRTHCRDTHEDLLHGAQATKFLLDVRDLRLRAAAHIGARRAWIQPQREQLPDLLQREPERLRLLYETQPTHGLSIERAIAGGCTRRLREQAPALVVPDGLQVHAALDRQLAGPETFHLAHLELASYTQYRSTGSMPPTEPHEWNLRKTVTSKPSLSAAPVRRTQVQVTRKRTCPDSR